MIKNSVRKKQRLWQWKELGTVRSFVDEGYAQPNRCLANGLYSVILSHFTNGTARITIIDPTCRHNWQHYQRIKNELLGEDWEGVELYPMTARLVDVHNMYHLWCCRRRLPFGWNDGFTKEEEEQWKQEITATGLDLCGDQGSITNLASCSLGGAV